MFTLSIRGVGGVLEQHLDTWEAREPELVKLIRKSLYVDLISDSATVQEAHELKQGAIQISRMQHSPYISGTLMPQNWSSQDRPVLEKSHLKCQICLVMSQLLQSNSW